VKKKNGPRLERKKNCKKSDNWLVNEVGGGGTLKTFGKKVQVWKLGK